MACLLIGFLIVTVCVGIIYMTLLWRILQGGGDGGK